MSAICGILNLNGEPIDQAMLQQMVDSSPYRGEDGIGYWQNANIGLAHRAFHVTPESVREKQPLKSTDGKLVLVADVRLDNREELISALPDAPDNPTDPDLLLAAFQKWGDACAEHLLGDFAFAIWNSDKRELFLARDPMGAFGFFWHRSGNRFLFASELSALLDNRKTEPVINETAVTKYLVGLDLGNDETFFEEFFACLPAHSMKVTTQGVSKSRYWDINPDYRINYNSDEEYTDHFLELLSNSVACRMRSIGPVGVSLSGGCDSSLIAAIASRLLPEMNLPQKQLKSFSYVFNEFPECDEREWIQPVVDQYHIDATYIPSDKKTSFSNIEQLPFYREFFSFDCYGQLTQSIMVTAASSGCKVVLDGHYGDTVFLGRSYFIADALWERRFVDITRWLRRHHSDIDFRQDIISRGLRQLIPRPMKRAYRKILPRPLHLFNRAVPSERVQHLKETLQEAETTSAFDRLSPGRQQRYRRLFISEAPHGYAISRGKFTNRYSVERASPYFDRRLIEFVLAIPPEQLNRPDEERFLQRNAMRRVLPAKVTQRQHKTSFKALLDRGMEEHGREVAAGLGENPLVMSQGWVEQEWFQQQQSQKQLDNSGFLLSIFINLELWLRSVEKCGLPLDNAPVSGVDNHKLT